MYETWLRSFHAVARHGGFTAAAGALNLSQPTITEQVKSLEGKFGVELFHRRGRTVRLSGPGAALYEITQGVAGHMEEALRFLEVAGETPAGRFAIGSVNPYYIMEPVRAFGAQYGNVDTVLSVDHRREVIQGLLDFRLDVALIGRRDPDPRITNTMLWQKRVHILLPFDHPLARRKSLKMSDLDGQPMLLREERSTTRLAFEKAVRHAGIKVPAVMEIDSREAIREAVALGIGFGLATDGEVLPETRLCSRPVSDAEMQVVFHAACLKNRAKRPLIDAFIKIAKNHTDAA